MDSQEKMPRKDTRHDAHVQGEALGKRLAVPNRPSLGRKPTTPMLGGSHRPRRSRHIDVSYPNPSVSKHAFTTFADHVLTTSQKITDHFQQIFHLANDHITTLPTGIDVSRFHPTGVKAKLPIRQEPGAPPVIGMVSVLRSWKGHGVFFDAVRKLHEAGHCFQCVVVGGAS